MTDQPGAISGQTFQSVPRMQSAPLPEPATDSHMTKPDKFASASLRPLALCDLLAHIRERISLGHAEILRVGLRRADVGHRDRPRPCARVDFLRLHFDTEFLRPPLLRCQGNGTVIPYLAGRDYFRDAQPFRYHAVETRCAQIFQRHRMFEVTSI